MMTTVPVAAIPPIGRAEATTLALTEYARTAEQWRTLNDADWTQPTDCSLWDVRAMAGHTAGMLATFTGYRHLFSSMGKATRASKRAGGPMIDSLTAQQVADRADRSVADLIGEVDTVGPRAARWRTSRPGPFRAMPLKQDVGGHTETWKMGYLLDVILTRDPWMHRVDTAVATGRELHLTGDHDGRIVADVVAEWARRHGAAFTLTLTGPAGGTFTAGTDGEQIEIDAVEFCRILAGRAPGTGLLGQPVPF